VKLSGKHRKVIFINISGNEGKEEKEENIAEMPVAECLRDCIYGR